MTRNTIALLGMPNAGKTSLFNALTGANQRVGNFPGVTVEKKTGLYRTASGRELSIIDLPGTYSLKPRSIDEEIALQVLKNDPEVVVVVADASNLERTLGLAIELKHLAKPMVLALNMFDIAERRQIKLDVGRLEKELGVPVRTTVATTGKGLDELMGIVEQLLASGPAEPLEPMPALSPLEIYRRVDEILEVAVTGGRDDTITRKLDRILLHPVLGPCIMFGVMFLMFQAVFAWAEAPMNWIEDGVSVLGQWIGQLTPWPMAKSLLVDGVIAGVGSVLVFLPQILILFLFIFLLEGTGYMTRAAFLLDRVMSLVGLRGQSFIPLLSSFACAIPGVMATRTIKDPRERLLTIMVAPLMTCSARLPVYVLLIGAFVPSLTLVGGIRLQGLVMFSLFIAAILSAMLVALVSRRFVLKGAKAPFIIEMPKYKIPNLRLIALNLWMRAKVFLKRAGTIILFTSIGLWFLSTFPSPPEGATEPAITYSYAGTLGQAIEPVFAPIGFDWRIATGIIPGFAAREVMVGALGTVFAVEDAEDELSGLPLLQSKIRASWPLGTGIALLVWYIFSPQCLATFAVIKRETNGWKWPGIIFAYTLTLAYLMAAVAFHLTNYLAS